MVWAKNPEGITAAANLADVGRGNRDVGVQIGALRAGFGCYEVDDCGRDFGCCVAVVVYA
jgi:hypothetical protein